METRASIGCGGNAQRISGRSLATFVVAAAAVGALTAGCMVEGARYDAPVFDDGSFGGSTVALGIIVDGDAPPLDHVVITVTGAGIGEPIVETFPGDAEEFVLSEIPAGTGRTIKVEAFAAPDAEQPFAQNITTGVSVPPEGSVNLDLNLTGIDSGNPFINEAPVIHGIIAKGTHIPGENRNPFVPGDEVPIHVVVSDNEAIPAANITWEAPDGGVIVGNGAAATWTAPDTLGDYEVIVRVVDIVDPDGLALPGSQVEGRITITVEAAPVLEPPALFTYGFEENTIGTGDAEADPPETQWYNFAGNVIQLTTRGVNKVVRATSSANSAAAGQQAILVAGDVDNSELPTLLAPVSGKGFLFRARISEFQAIDPNLIDDAVDTPEAKTFFGLVTGDAEGTFGPIVPRRYFPFAETSAFLLILQADFNKSDTGTPQKVTMLLVEKQGETNKVVNSTVSPMDQWTVNAPDMEELFPMTAELHLDGTRYQVKIKDSLGQDVPLLDASNNASDGKGEHGRTWLNNGYFIVGSEHTTGRFGYSYYDEIKIFNDRDLIVP